MKNYCCVATSSRAWAQQIAVNYIKRSYHRFVMVPLPKHKAPAVIDRKIITKYNIDITDSARLWRKREGYARYQYIRRDRIGMILIGDPTGPKNRGKLSILMSQEKYKKLITEYGENLYCSTPETDSNGNVVIDFEKEEGGYYIINEGTEEEAKIPRIKHLYQYPICHEGYEIRYRNGIGSVRIDDQSYEALRRRLLGAADQRDLKAINEIFNRLRLQPFAPVKSQLWKLVDELNGYLTKRHIRGMTVPYSVVGKCLRRVTGPLTVPPGKYPTQNVKNNQKPWSKKERRAA